MLINDAWTITDRVSGLRLSVRRGLHLNCLTIEFVGQPIVGSRDFFFDKEGGYDGAGACLAVPTDIALAGDPRPAEEG